MDRVYYQNEVLFISRLLLATLFIVAGFGKIFSITEFAAMMAKHDLPFASLSPYPVIVIELLGGLVFLCGYQTRLLAVLFAIFTIFSALVAHQFWGLTDPAAKLANQINFFKNLSIAGGFLAVYVTGGGRFSVDGWRRSQS